MTDDNIIELHERTPDERVSFLRKAIQASWDGTVMRARVFGATIDEIRRPWRWMWAPSEDHEVFEHAESRDAALTAAFDENPDELAECFICEARSCAVQNADDSYFELIAENLIEELEENEEVFSEAGQLNPTDAEFKQLAGMLSECVEVWLLSRGFKGRYIDEQRNEETVTKDQTQG